MSQSYQTGFVRVDLDGSLVTSAGPGNYALGFIRDAAGALVTNTGTGVVELGFMRDANNNLIIVDKSVAVGAAWKTGFLRDSNGALVTVSEALAAAPIAFWSGFLRDTSGALVILAPGSTSIHVNAAPTGPATPIGTWTNVMAEGFSTAAPAFAAAGSLWGNTRDTGASPRPAFSGQGVNVYQTSQVAVGPSGAVLTAQFVSAGAFGTNGSGKPISYTSGCMTSEFVNGQGGSPGFPNITGFMWAPVLSSGAVTAFECVMTLPATNQAAGTGGQDMAFWMENPTGVNEVDMPELAGILNPPPGCSSIWAAIDHTHGVNNQYQAFNPAWQTDGLQHRYTTIFDCRSGVNTMQGYVDGVLISGGPNAIPPAMPANPMYITLSYEWKDDTIGNHPTFTGQEKCIIRSVACYQDSLHLGTGITTLAGAWTAPIVATGTLVP